MKSEKSKKRLRTALVIIVCVILILTLVIGGFNLAFYLIGRDKQYGVAEGYQWTAADNFDVSQLKTFEMGDKDYKILVMTDIHINNRGTFAKFLGINYLLDWAGEIAIKNLVNYVKPDLIAVLGDTVCGDRNDLDTARFVKIMDSMKTPWACVFGNHDDEGRADKKKLVDELLKSEYGLFQFGAADLHGAGNYTVRLTRAEKTEYALFFMDSGSSLEFPNKTDGINAKQVEWYNWTMDGLTEEGAYPKNMAFFHIPTKEFATADAFVAGGRDEPPSNPNIDAGIVSAMRQKSGTHITVGHDHDNNFIADIGNFKLIYGNKSSYNSYFKSDRTGGTLITIKADGNVTEEIVNF